MKKKGRMQKKKIRTIMVESFLHLPENQLSLMTGNELVQLYAYIYCYRYQCLALLVSLIGIFQVTGPDTAVSIFIDQSFRFVQTLIEIKPS